MVCVKKTIKCKIIKPTELKLKQLNKEYSNLQELLQLESKGVEFLDIYKTLKKKVYSANLQQALRFYKKILPNKEYPISFRKDLLDIRKTDNKLSEYWVRIPTKQRRGGLNLAIKSQPFKFEDYEICESKLFKKKNNWFLNLTVQKEVELNNTYTSTLAVDLGEKVIATTVLSSKINPNFYGKEIRGIRKKYAYIRKQLGKKKLLKEIKRIGQKEQRKVTDSLNKISSDIVRVAQTSNALIVLGDLKGIRNSAKGKGKRFNRIVSNMPYCQLTQMIEYKANWEGISVVKIPEAYTSKTCSKCGSLNTSRTNQSNFKCKNCGYYVNADFNGAKNILNRSCGYILPNRVVSESTPNQSLTLEAPQLVGGQFTQKKPYIIPVNEIQRIIYFESGGEVPELGENIYNKLSKKDKKRVDKIAEPIGTSGVRGSIEVEI